MNTQARQGTRSVNWTRRIILVGLCGLMFLSPITIGTMLATTVYTPQGYAGYFVLHLLWMMGCMLCMWQLVFKRDLADRHTRDLEDRAWLEKRSKAFDERYQQLQAETEQLLAESEDELRQVLEQYRTPLEPDSVLSRIRDLDVETTTHQEADGRWSLNIRPRLTTTPR